MARTDSSHGVAALLLTLLLLLAPAGGASHVVAMCLFRKHKNNID